MSKIIESEIEGNLEDTTVSMNQWIKEIRGDRQEIIPEAGLYLKDNIGAWMLGPVGLYKGRPITAESRFVSSIQEFKELLENLDKGTTFIMYMPIYNGSYPEFKHIGNEKYEYTGERKSCWKIRGVFVQD